MGKAAVTLHRRPQSGVQNFRAPWGKYDYYELIDHDLLPSHGIPAMCSQGGFGGYQSAPTVCKVALQYITTLVSFYGHDVKTKPDAPSPSAMAAQRSKMIAWIFEPTGILP